jgi:hypothetical protein
MRTRDRIEDMPLGCQYDHGSFERGTRAWGSHLPVIIAMVGMNGWNMRVAAKGSRIFYKIWPTLVLGLLPTALVLNLLVRRW